ncbi:Fe-S cluster assembly protein IscX [Candidatus Anaplasma sp. TIGMIC]|uniref:Fe-S cluster assembly protein IscX n=1 Tax=Candidatus Anaplasma sp. TIGMIC TaxID=3020713 RepID=UPI00232C91DF|nr:Fe-S cluster assembly protein IscX [Candidatus Anaplasma sp. TIGMIC]MDB1135035.1 Fe-S cluster assembly protein IscX [Candidatus Anaplasma sp. TIGMIC]
MKWDDTEEIVALLEEFFPEQDIFALRFTELREMVMSLPGFDADDDGCNESVLEAIQMGWYSEREEK